LPAASVYTHLSNLTLTSACPAATWRRSTVTELSHVNVLPSPNCVVARLTGVRPCSRSLILSAAVLAACLLPSYAAFPTTPVPIPAPMLAP